MSSDSVIDASLAATLEAEAVLQPQDRSVTFDNVAGLTAAKETLIDAQTSRRGVLLFGPPGTGKTFLLKAAGAHASGTTVLQMNISIMVHFTKKGIRGDAVIAALFHVARRNAPSTIVFDDVECLVERHGGGTEASARIHSELLRQLDAERRRTDGTVEDIRQTDLPSQGSATESGNRAQEREQTPVLVICTTNSPWNLDLSLCRRLPQRVFIPLPDRSARMDLLKIHTTGLDFDEGIDIERVADVTDGYSGADLVVLCRDAAMQPLRRLMAGKSQEEVAALAADMDSESLIVSREDFVEAVQRSRRSVGPEDVRRFQLFESAAS